MCLFYAKACICEKKIVPLQSELEKGMGKAAELWFRIGSYALFMLRSRNTMGYGIHSPYLFYIARTIIPKTAGYYCFEEVEKVRREMLRDTTEITIEDFGVGGGSYSLPASGNSMVGATLPAAPSVRSHKSRGFSIPTLGGELRKVVKVAY